MKHKHSELIKQWADGAKIEFFNRLTQSWQDADNPVWSVNDQYRVKPEAWKEALVKAIKDGKQVEYNSGYGWEPASLLHRCVKDDNFEVYSWYEEDSYRVKPQPLEAWQQALVNAVKEGKVVKWRATTSNDWYEAVSLISAVKLDRLDEYNWQDRYDYCVQLQDWQIELVKAIQAGEQVEVLIGQDTWVNADTLHRLAKNDELEHYEWLSKEHYRLKPQNLYMWAYETGDSWYVFSKLMSEAEAKVYTHKLGIEKYRKITQIS